MTVRYELKTVIYRVFKHIGGVAVYPPSYNGEARLIAVLLHFIDHFAHRRTRPVVKNKRHILCHNYHPKKQIFANSEPRNYERGALRLKIKYGLIAVNAFPVLIETGYRGVGHRMRNNGFEYVG